MAEAAARPRPNWPKVALAGGMFGAVCVWVGLWLGGAYALQRNDIGLAIPMLLAFAFIYLRVVRRWCGPVTAAVMAIIGAIAAMLAAAQFAQSYAWKMGLLSLGPAAVFLGATLLALLAAQFLRRLTGAWPLFARIAVLAVAAMLWWLAGHVALGRAYTPTAEQAAGRTILLTGLPLVEWAKVGGGPVGRREDVTLMALRPMLARQLVPVDALTAMALTPADVVLLAHPRALPPETLVEIDRFVRGGGNAVILADALSGWPPPFAMGDPRNPPITSLLTPLLDHWGIELAAPSPDGAMAGNVRVTNQGALLAMHSAGHFSRLPGNCRSAGALADGQRVIARCRIGAGTAVIVGDADLLFAPLWQSTPHWARHLRPSDNIEWLAAEINRSGRRGLWDMVPNRTQWPGVSATALFANAIF